MYSLQLGRRHSPPAHARSVVFTSVLSKHSARHTCEAGSHTSFRARAQSPSSDRV